MKINKDEITPLLKKQVVTDEEIPRDKRRVLHVVYWWAILNAVNVSAINPTLLLYLQHIGLASTTDVSFYVFLTASKSAVPVIMNVGMGMLSARIGAPRSMGICCVAIVLGLLGMCVATTKVSFTAVYCFGYGLSYAVRTVRTVLLSEVVPSKLRTSRMSLHTFMSPFGSLFGPFVWLMCERFRREIVILHFFRINAFTLNFFVAASIVACYGTLGVLFGRYEGDTNLVQTRRKQADKDIAIPVRLRDGSVTIVHSKSYKRNTVMLFCLIILCGRVSMALFDQSFQPILINTLGASGREMGLIFATVSIFALVPPLIVAVFSTLVEDRVIMLFGMMLKLVGAAMYLPWFGHVRKWQVITGYILLVKSSIFVYTSAMSLFTRLLGEMSTGTVLGILSSTQAFGYCSAQLFLGSTTLQLFGTFELAILAAPIALGVLTLMLPAVWSRLNPNREFVRVLHREYDCRQRS